MGFWRGVKQGLRAKGLWLDAEQARVILKLALRGAAYPPHRLSTKEDEILARFAKRCKELA